MLALLERYAMYEQFIQGSGYSKCLWMVDYSLTSGMVEDFLFCQCPKGPGAQQAFSLTVMG
jgi:hypothetical protein